jgi:hypothetical protein
MPPALRLDHDTTEPRCRFATRSVFGMLSLEVSGMNIELELEEDRRKSQWVFSNHMMLT